jgi:hypothetical protein
MIRKFQVPGKFGDLLSDISRTQLRKAVGNAIEEFKKAEGLRGNDNIAISCKGFALCIHVQLTSLDLSAI